MKQYAVIKVGYTAGVYGCSGEYFNCIFFDENGLQNFCFSGMYGADGRVKEEMNNKGYEQKYLISDFGKMTTRGNDRIAKGRFMSEHKAVEYIKNGFKK